MFSTKQYIVMILAFPIHHSVFHCFNPTLRQLRAALKFYTGIDVTVRQIRNLLRELEDDGIIRREYHHRHFGPHEHQGQANSYRVVDFKGAFQDLFSLVGSSRQASARERNRIRMRKARKRGTSD